MELVSQNIANMTPNPRIEHAQELFFRDDERPKQPPPVHCHEDLGELHRTFWRYHRVWRPILVTSESTLDYNTARFIDRPSTRTSRNTREVIKDHYIVLDGTPYFQVDIRNAESPRWYDVEEYMMSEPAKCFFYVMEKGLLWEDIAWFKALPGHRYLFREDGDYGVDPEPEDRAARRERRRLRAILERNARRMRRARRAERSNDGTDRSVARMPRPVARRAGPPTLFPPVESESSDSE